jgi:hypothetical protein
MFHFALIEAQYFRWTRLVVQIQLNYKIRHHYQQSPRLNNTELVLLNISLISASNIQIPQSLLSEYVTEIGRSRFG